MRLRDNEHSKLVTLSETKPVLPAPVPQAQVSLSKGGSRQGRRAHNARLPLLDS